MTSNQRRFLLFISRRLPFGWLIAFSLSAQAAVPTPRLHLARISDVRTPKTIDTIPLRGKLALAEDGGSAVVGALDGSVWSWRPGRTKQLLVPGRLPVSTIDVTPDGRWAVTGSEKTVRYWDVRADEQLWSRA